MADIWPEVRLAELCNSIDYGYTASASSTSVGPRFLRITDIVNGPIDWKTVPFCKIDDESVEKYRLYNGDIVIARTGATTGVSAYISEPPTAVFASYLVRLKVGTRTDARFISYSLKSDIFWAYIRGVLGDKSAQPNASAKTMTQVKLRIPPLPEQRAIAHILGKLDDKIELNQQMNQTLETMAQALFKSWFVDFEPFLDQGMEDSPLGPIPKGWRVGKISELTFLSREGVNPSDCPDEMFDHYSIPAFDEGRLPKAEIGKDILSNKFLVPSNAVLLSKLNPRFPRVWLTSFSSSRRSLCSTEFLVALPLPGVSREYLYSLFCSRQFLEIFSTLVTGTSGSHQRVKPDYLLTMDTVIPNGDTIARFSNVSKPLHARVAQNLEESQTLTSIRDTLLPKLLSGEIRVKDAERFAERAV